MPPSHFAVYTANSDVDGYFAHSLAEKLASEYNAKSESDKGAGPTELTTVSFESFLEVDFVRKMKELERQHGGSFLLHRGTHVLLRDGKYLGTVDALKALAVKEFKMPDLEHFGNPIVLNRRSREDYQQCVLAAGRPIVFLDFADGAKKNRNAEASSSSAVPVPVYGRIVIELFTDRCPMACENFLKLCTGELGATEEAKLHYVGCPVHRVVPGGWIQCGDIVGGTGKNSLAAIGENGRLADENFTFDFSNPLGGMVGWSTSEPHSIGSQFFITLGKCGWMNGEFEGFGRVIQGYTVLKTIETCAANNQRPARPIIIGDAGKIEFK